MSTLSRAGQRINDLIGAVRSVSRGRCGVGMQEPQLAALGATLATARTP